MLFIAFALVPPIVAEGQTQSVDTSFNNVTVDLAYDMITDGSFPDLVILDVRDQYEYAMGHLYDAVLIPHDGLETRIGELEEHKNHEIIVYCRSGYRSAIASEILANHSFTKVYNMLGGILAWIEADYPIYTTSHHVTVNVVDEETLLQIEPLLLHQTGCVSCAQNHTCPSDSEPTNITSTVLEENETHTLTLLTYEVNGTTFELTILNTLLWSYNELTDEINRTATFTSTEITAENMSTQVYGLSYLVQHAEYNLTINTLLTPLNSETYNTSFTIMNYAPAEKSVISMEFVEFNSSVILSQQYAILGKVAKEVGKIYEESGDETLAQLAPGYDTMKDEAKYLSKLVEKQLQEYDKEILHSSAILSDASSWNCLNCAVGIIMMFMWSDPVCFTCGLCLAGGSLTWALFLLCLALCTVCILSIYLDYYECYLCAVYLGLIPNGNGCVAEGTLITMADGSTKPIEEIQIGDQVLGFDPTTGTFMAENVFDLIETEVEAMVYLNNGMLKLTPLDQPIFIRNSTYEGWTQDPVTIEVGWEIYNVTSGGWVPVTSVTYEEGKTRVYDMVLDGYTTYIANGILVMDKNGC